MRLLAPVLALALLAACARDPAPDRAPLMGDAGRGMVALREFDCGACHVIPGIREARGHTGPSLEDFKRRVYIAGLRPNRPDELVRFLVDPPALKPHTLMPAQGLDEPRARDIAAYLYL